MNHPRRCGEGLAMVEAWFKSNLAPHFPAKQNAEILAI
jgi:hypothetical protein